MSEKYSWLITSSGVTVNFDGESKSLKKEDKSYQTVISSIRDNDWDKVKELLNPAHAVNEFSNGEMRIENGQVFVKSATGEFPVACGLNSTILHYIKEKLPFEPLVKFAKNLNENPSYNSVNQLFLFLEKNHFAITENGNFIAYKSVTSDFKDVYSKTFDNSI